MIKKCRFCNGDIPDERWASAWYCSDKHAYEAKKKRSLKQYYQMRGGQLQIKENEAILAKFYELKSYGVLITFEMLDKAGFDWGFSTEELQSEDGNIWKVVGKHAYHIDPNTKNISIWKKN